MKSMSQDLVTNRDQLSEIMSKEIARAGQATGAKTIYRASARLRKNLSVEASARQFTFLVDEPPTFGGDDSGPNPEELVLAAVGACQVITASLYAALLGIHLSHYEVALKGYLDLRGFYGIAVSGKSAGFDRVVCEVRIESDASEDKLRQFEQLVEERCVGHGTLQNPVRVESEWILNGQRLAAG